MSPNCEASRTFRDKAGSSDDHIHVCNNAQRHFGLHECWCGIQWDPREQALPLDKFKEAVDQSAEQSRSQIRRKSSMDPQWAAREIIRQMKVIDELNARIIELENKYLYNRPVLEGL